MSSIPYAASTQPEYKDEGTFGIRFERETI